MRATGFIVDVDGHRYLVTARHNVFPTQVNIPNPRTGGSYLRYNADFQANILDVYFPHGGDWSHHRIQLSNLPPHKIITTPESDLLAVQLPQNIEIHDATSFTPEDIQTDVEPNESLVAYGYGQNSLPDESIDYTVSEYPYEIKTPQELTLSAVPLPADGFDSISNVIGTAIDEESSSAYLYNGLSGSPVLGDGLVGIYTSSSEFPEEVGNANPSLVGTTRVDYVSSNLISTALRL
ncbi:hypothetical protein [Halanaeroarchaeum sp. HSR-CO]|uniref:hypothetical protein n=1 Tax=Halanaeroarchaeum sp. HSR-CO TaxID=2866382 RepID=UPI00217CE476|nr:hypothetical protein [Halanaeroarchaeum sp. HSR-CO]